MQIKKRIARVNSLRVRTIASSLLLSVVLLPIIGFALNNAFSKQILENVKEQLNAYFYSVLAVTEFENNELLMPEVLLDNQFNVINSGYYALITEPLEATVDSADNSTNNLLWFSNSFLGASLNSRLPAPEVGNSEFSEVRVNQQGHFIFSYTVRFDLPATDEIERLPVITLHIIMDRARIEVQQKAFSNTLFTWFVVLSCAFLLVQFIWLAWTLNPLAKFSNELKIVQTGKQEHISLDYPNELKAVATQINALLKNEKQQRQRYRNSLSDLAHSLKTPLAVMQSQQDHDNSSVEQIKKINQIINHQLKRAQSSNQSWHKGVEVIPVCQRLTRTLAKIYPDKNINEEYSNIENLLFFGDENDLTEMLGNILDNACKAATREVKIHIVQSEHSWQISIEDDGRGISNNQRAAILERGKRLDTYEHGHGIGLSIVQDLADTYQVKLSIHSSNLLGGAKFILLFKRAF